MVFVCEACGSSFKYNSDHGLRQHQLNCEEFLQADNEASTVDDALEKYRRKLQRKRQRKRQKAALSEVSLTGSGVCYSFILYFYTHHSLQAFVAIDMATTDENITLGLELEHEVTPPNDTSENPSHSKPPDPEVNIFSLETSQNGFAESQRLPRVTMSHIFLK